MNRADFVQPFPGRLVSIGPGVEAFVPDALPAALSLPGPLLRPLGEARALLGRLTEGVKSLPSLDLFLEPFQKREAVLSSRIEGTVTTLDEALVNAATVEEHELNDDAREVNNYEKALKGGIAELAKGRPLSTSLVRGMHTLLMANVRGQEKSKGEFREAQVGLGLPQAQKDLKLARFIPPPPLEVRPCLERLDEFLRDRGSDLEPLVRIALGHYQFETIHPFEDGNGRSGRLLVALQMVWEGLMDRPLLYVSPALERQRDKYCAMLYRVSCRGAFAEWIDFFVSIVRDTAVETLERIEQLRELEKDFRRRLHKVQSQKPLQLAHQLFASPYMTAPMAAKVLAPVTPMTAQGAIDRLVQVGILELTERKLKLGGRGRPPHLYRCAEILRIMRE
jgi:Fic family protein